MVSNFQIRAAQPIKFIQIPPHPDNFEMCSISGPKAFWIMGIHPPPAGAVIYPCSLVKLILLFGVVLRNLQPGHGGACL